MDKQTNNRMKIENSGVGRHLLGPAINVLTLIYINLSPQFINMEYLWAKLLYIHQFACYKSMEYIQGKQQCSIKGSIRQHIKIYSNFFVLFLNTNTINVMLFSFNPLSCTPYKHIFLLIDTVAKKVNKIRFQNTLKQCYMLKSKRLTTILKQC